MSMLGTAAVNCVPLTNVVVSATPFHSTTEPLTKPLPVTVSVNAGEPAAKEDGDSNVCTATGLLIVNVSAPDAPPPGAGLNTVTEAVPELARSMAGTLAVTRVALTNVVVNATPFHCTTEPLTKLLPFTVSVNVSKPAIAKVRNSDVDTGTGLLIVKVSGFDVPPPRAGLNTVTGTVPELAMSIAGTAAVNCAALMNVVVSATPFHCTTDPLTKLLPFTVSVNVALPTAAKFGASDVSTGTGLLAIITSVNTDDALPEKLASPL